MARDAGKVITVDRAMAAAKAAGLSIGGQGFDFASDSYTPKGLYAYKSGPSAAGGRDNCARTHTDWMRLPR